MSSSSIGRASGFGSEGFGFEPQGDIMLKPMRLKEEHPFLNKVRKLEKLAEELKINIQVGIMDQIIIVDEETGQDYQYRDVEQALDSDNTTTSFPWPFENKLVYEKDMMEHLPTVEK